MNKQPIRPTLTALHIKYQGLSTYMPDEGAINAQRGVMNAMSRRAIGARSEILEPAAPSFIRILTINYRYDNSRNQKTTH